MKNIKLFQKFYDLGYNDKSIALETNSKPYTVGKWRRMNNLNVNKLIDRYHIQIKDMVSNNMSNKQISNLLPISNVHICTIRRELGIPSSPYKRIEYNTSEQKLKSRIIIRSRSRAKQRNINFSLTIEDFTLPIYCPILNIKLDYFSIGTTKNTASLDRIDNSKGYISGNVMIISYLANSMKNSASKEELIMFTKNILKFI